MGRHPQGSSVTPLQTVPTLAQRLGDFSGLQAAYASLTPIFDPATTTGLGHLRLALSTAMPGTLSKEFAVSGRYALNLRGEF